MALKDYNATVSVNGGPEHEMGSPAADKAVKEMVGHSRMRIKQKPAPKDVSGISGNLLKSFIERIERMEEEKKALGEDIRAACAEGNATGFDPKIMRKIVALRKTNLEKRREEQDLFQLYCTAIGMEV